MFQSFYENHTHQDPDFHILFSYQTLKQNNHLGEIMHWHESIELIFVTEGSCIVTCGLDPFIISSGELFLINSNELHSFKAHSPATSYYCLIIDKLIYEHLSLPIEEITFTHLVQSPTICQAFLNIVSEMQTHQPYYKLAVKNQIIGLLIELLRNYSLGESISLVSSKQDPKVLLVKNAISYIRKNLSSPPTLEEICIHIGLSKYYFCHIFKEVTNKTVTQYTNHLRCQYAQKLLRSGHYTVTEVAELCGFNSLPYFCRLYKRYLGISPSETHS